MQIHIISTFDIRKTSKYSSLLHSLNEQIIQIIHAKHVTHVAPVIHDTHVTSVVLVIGAVLG